MLAIEVPKAARAAFRNLASPDPLTRLTGVAQTRRWLDGLERELVEEARAAEATWVEIGAALGVTGRQARRRAPAEPG